MAIWRERNRWRTPLGAQLDVLGDRMIENVYFTYFAVVGMVSAVAAGFVFLRVARRRTFCAALH